MGEVDAEALHEKWLGWLKKIENETMTVWLYRDYWRGLVEITKANPDLPPSNFFDAMGVWYASAQATAVRRQRDKDRRAISFWRLLTEMAEHPEVMTRERHVALWGKDEADAYEQDHWKRTGDENYSKFAGEGQNTIAPERTLEDRARIEAILQPVVDYVNQQIAHTDENALTQVPTYDQLHAALDELGELLKKYVSLFEAAMLGAIAPVHQYDWKAPFRVPWIKPDEGRTA